MSSDPVRKRLGAIQKAMGVHSCPDGESLEQAQARATERETWFHTLFDTIPLSAALIDQDTLEFLQFNDAAAENLGYTREEFAKLTVFDIEAFFSPEQLRQFADQRKSSVVLETKHRTKSGGVRDVVVYIRLMTMDGREVANCVWEDVTEKKAAEAALLQSEKLASAGRMAATVAHEINNPLTAVTNFVYLVRTDPDLLPKFREQLEAAELELRRVAHTVKQTLGFYRESTKPAVVDVRALVNEVVELYCPRLKSKDIRLRIEHVGRCDNTMSIAGEIRHVISNLFTNAIDASRRKGTITIRSNRVTLSGFRYTRLTVADTGAGISAANQSHIFEPFFTTKKAIGTGLGLWVSRKIVERHNGRIRIRSIEGKGTVTSIFLPAQVPAGPNGASATDVDDLTGRK